VSPLRLLERVGWSDPLDLRIEELEDRAKLAAVVVVEALLDRDEGLPFVAAAQGGEEAVGERGGRPQRGPWSDSTVRIPSQ
jgi:hypothetical protein